jgi:serine/threonine-protein phosphatase 6 regulatory ankyrin repeat subunit B
MNTDTLWIISRYLDTPTWGNFRIAYRWFYRIPTKEDIYNRIKHIDWFEAAKKGNYSILKTYIDVGFDFNNKQDNSGETALILASWNGRTECVQLLIDSGADLNTQNNYGSTALLWASRRGHTTCVQLLIDSGAHLNTQNNGDYTALLWASRNGHTECVRLLIDSGADVNKQHNGYGSTALMLASSFDRTECVQLLINSGADLNTQSSNGSTALMRTSKNGTQGVFSYLLILELI